MNQLAELIYELTMESWLNVQSFAGIGKFIGIFSLPLSGCKGRKW